MTLPTFDALVLAGGRGRRLGTDKPEVEVGGRTMLQRVLDACTGADRVVVVGPRRSLPPGVLATQETPPGGGPLAAIVAGAELVRADVVVVLGADLPFVTPADVALLRGALATEPPGATDAVVAGDHEGRGNWLCGAWRVGPLRAALAGMGDPAGRAVRDLDGLVRIRVLPTIEAPGDSPWFDIDTPADLEVAARRAQAATPTNRPA